MYLAPQTDGSLTLTLPDDIPAGYTRCASTRARCTARRD